MYLSINGELIMNTLNQLLIKTAQHDHAAFQELYKEVSPKLFQVSLRFVNYDKETAEDVLQEAFIKIWNKADKFNAEKGSAMAWMSRVVRNQAFDKLRSYQSRPALDEYGDFETAEYASKDLLPEQQSTQTQQLGLFKNILDGLPEMQRRCLSLSLIYGHTHIEISEKMEIPLGTIKSWIRRNVDQIRDTMEDKETCINC